MDRGKESSSGYIGDDVTWLFTGIAGLAVLPVCLSCNRSLPASGVPCGVFQSRG